MRSRILSVVGAVVACSLFGVSAQEAPTKTPSAQEAVAPTLPASVPQAFMELQVQFIGLSRAQAVLQKEADAIAAQLQRTLDQARAVCAAVPGYELAMAPAMTCAKKKPAPKKDGSQ